MKVKLEQSTALLVGLLAVAVAVTVVGLSATAQQAPTEEAGSNVYIDSFGGEDVSNMDSPWSSQDFTTINPVVYTDEDQDTAGNATIELENGTTFDDSFTSYVKLVTGAEGEAVPSVMSLKAEFDDTGEFTSSNTGISKAVLRDYDETSEVATFNELRLTAEETVEGSTTVGEGEFVLQANWDAQSVTTNSAEGNRDTIATVDVNLQSPDAPSDQPSKAEDFSYDVLTK